MHTPYRPLCLALLLASAPIPATAQPDQVTTRAKRKQKKSPQDKANAQNKYLQVGGITIVVGLLVGVVYLLYPTQEDQYFDGTTLFNASVDPNNENGKTFRQALIDAIKNKNTTEGTWQTWITKKDDGLVSTLARIFKANQWNITSTQGGPNGDVARIGDLEHGMIDDPGNATSLGVAYGLAQVLHLLIQVAGEPTMKKLVQQNNNRFLANLVDRNTSTPCRESIYVLLNLGGADPTAQPSFGSNDNYLFFNNKGQNAQTIQQIAAQGDQGRNKLEIKKNNDQWTVANLPNNNN